MRAGGGSALTEDLVTRLLPVLSRSLTAEFNVFDVMRHGTHEKQLSNVFAWTLDASGTHGFGDLFVRIFVDEVNRGRSAQEHFGYGPYVVFQEVNTSGSTAWGDIADIVLQSDDAVLVVENYFTSDGHGHGYKRYLDYGRRGRRRSAVVLLCLYEDGSLLADGWENAAVVTYERLLERLLRELDRKRGYRAEHSESYSFIAQMHRKFVKGRGPVEDRELLQFVTAMCVTGEAGRYAETPHEAAATNFANDIAEQARERFNEGRLVLQRVKDGLRSYSQQVLLKQLNETLGDGFVTRVFANFVGNYRWTINFDTTEYVKDFGEAHLQLKFGPSAWFANENDPYWKHTVARESADYSRVFITNGKRREIRQSAVTLQEALSGIGPQDRRLHDEIVELLRSDP